MFFSKKQICMKLQRTHMKTYKHQNLKQTHRENHPCVLTVAL